MNAIQTSFIDQPAAPRSTKKAAPGYSAQRYRAHFVRENDAPEQTLITDKYAARDLALKYLGDCPFEKIIIIALDSANRVTGFQVVEGEPGQCFLSPQNTFRFLLSCFARSFIIAHNHPAGTMTPSSGDWTITKLLVSTGKALNVDCLDHLIISDGEIVSMKNMHEWPK